MATVDVKGLICPECSTLFFRHRRSVSAGYITNCQTSCYDLIMSAWWSSVISSHYHWW